MFQRSLLDTIRQLRLPVTIAILLGVLALAQGGSAAIAADPPNQPFDLIYSAENVKYRIDHFGVGMLDTTTGNLTVPANVVDGTDIIKAYLIWAGLGQDDDGVLLQRVGVGSPQRIQADWVWNNSTYGGQTWGCCGNELSVYAADITATDIITHGPTASIYTVSDMDIQHVSGSGRVVSENWGVSLLIVFEADDVNPRDIFVKLGNDGLFANWTGLYGPNSDVQCMDFDTAPIARKAAFEVIVGGVATDKRFNALWGRSGDEPYTTYTPKLGATWNQDKGLINLPPNINGIDPSLQALAEPTLANNFTSPFDDSSGDEWDVYKRFDVDIPADHNWACLQIESASQENRPDLPPIVPGSPTNENLAASIGFLGFIAYVDVAEEPEIEIVKLTNGQDANDPDGADVPVIAPGDTVTWTYVVTNIGVIDINEEDISVTDDVIGTITAIVDKGDNDAVLSPGEVWRYQATGSAVNLVNPPDDPDLNLVEDVCTQDGALTVPSTAYTNIGAVTIPSMQDTDPSSYCAPQPEIEIIKYTNGQDANDPDGADVPVIAPGDTVTWTYVVTNIGAIDINEEDISVTDDVIGTITAIVDKGDNDAVLSPGEVWRYQATGSAVNLVNPPDDPDLNLVEDVCTQDGALTVPSTAYTNIGAVTIPSMQDTDPSSYCAPQPEIEIIKYTNGQDANDPDGADVPVIAPGDTVTWTFRVTNIGPIDINEEDITVTDNVIGPITMIADKADGDGVLTPNESWIYFATGQALDLANPGNTAGLQLAPNVCTAGGAETRPSTAYTNIGTVNIPSMEDSDPSSYCGPVPTGIDDVDEPSRFNVKIYIPLLVR